MKEALADLIASLNARLGTDGYLLDVDVVEGDLDLSGLEFATEANRAREAAPSRDVSTSEAASPEVPGLEREDPTGRRAPVRRRKHQANAGPDPVDGEGAAAPRAETPAPARRRGGRRS